jgi:hypothetical protein
VVVECRHRRVEGQQPQQQQQQQGEQEVDEPAVLGSLVLPAIAAASGGALEEGGGCCVEVEDAGTVAANGEQGVKVEAARSGLDDLVMEGGSSDRGSSGSRGGAAAAGTGTGVGAVTKPQPRAVGQYASILRGPSKETSSAGEVCTASQAGPCDVQGVTSGTAAAAEVSQGEEGTRQLGGGGGLTGAGHKGGSSSSSGGGHKEGGSSSISTSWRHAAQKPTCYICYRVRKYAEHVFERKAVKCGFVVERVPMRELHQDYQCGGWQLLKLQMVL